MGGRPCSSCHNRQLQIRANWPQRLVQRGLHAAIAGYRPAAASSPGAPPRRADAACSLTIAACCRARGVVIRIVAARRPGRPRLRRPAGPSRPTLRQSPMRRTAYTRVFMRGWHQHLQLRQLRPNCDWRTVATNVSSVRGPWNASASCQKRAARLRPAAAASQQQAQRTRQTASRENG